MRKLFAYTFDNTMVVEKSYLDDKFASIIALMMFDCDDCKNVVIVDGFTGEILEELEK